jgi:hypothetical protein
MRSGIRILEDTPGDGPAIERQHVYRLRLRMWLHRGEPVRWTTAWGFVDQARLEDEGATLVTCLRIDRRSLISGLFYGVEGMRIGGTRRLEISPHLAYGENGVPGLIPKNALLVAEVIFLEASPAFARGSQT